MKVKQLFEKLIENWPVKAVCFIMALFLYVFNQQSGMTSKTVKTTLAIDRESGFRPAEAFNNSVTVSFKGKSEEIASIMEKDISAYIDLNYVAKEGKYDFPVLLKLNDNVTAINPLEIKVTPEIISLRVEPEIAGFAEIVPLVKGKVPHGYEIKSISVNPEQVKIRGAVSLVNNCKTLQTATVPVSNATRSFQTTVKIENPRRSLTVEEQTVSVTVEVDEVKDSRMLKNVPVNLVKLHPGLEAKFSPKTVNVNVEGSQLSIEKIRDYSSIIKADCAALDEPGTYELKLNYSLPSGVKLSENPVKTVSVTVSMKHENSEEKLTIVEDQAGTLEEKVEEGASQ
ncbi:MAG: hypothetical protein KBT11_05650 [Treponema sp.]|nr:hypothetical protein [Candidatus Treponema equifaecale]